ncbi:hypothetical protein [Pseudonocardia acidicola]|uniref:Uncharacterized protein n=1 Tax=Pseudonocardia acidicola TaxID=2724939 RepID=A0ABX1SC41_9PSEU|nr:hypothetical protein [Pseudonocardia acidicola]NMH97921.1 hypothetical protein [Pseudonocardia acidicola]
MPHAGGDVEPGLGRRALAHLIVAGALGCAAIAGCGTSPAPSAGPATITPTAAVPAPATSTAYSAALCSAAAQFQTAANAIVTLDATKVGTDGVKAALQNLQTAGRNLVAAAKDQFGPQVAGVEQSLASLQTTIAGLSDQPSLSAKLGALISSVSDVEQAAEPIVASVRTGCTGVPVVETPPAS